jgi:hypothetical protein
MLKGPALLLNLSQPGAEPPVPLPMAALGEPFSCSDHDHSAACERGNSVCVCVCVCVLYRYGGSLWEEVSGVYW